MGSWGFYYFLIILFIIFFFCQWPYSSLWLWNGLVSWNILKCNRDYFQNMKIGLFFESFTFSLPVLTPLQNNEKSWKKIIIQWDFNEWTPKSDHDKLNYSSENAESIDFNCIWKVYSPRRFNWMHLLVLCFMNTWQHFPDMI